MKYDLVIAYRIYPKVSKDPAIFSEDKYKLAKFCLKSFKAALEDINFKMYALLDGCPDEYEDLFKEVFPEGNVEILRLNKIGNKQTFKKQIEILSTQNDSDVVYFAEDDYFYIKNIKNMIDLLKSKKADFVTPYMHPTSCEGSAILTNTKTVFSGEEYVIVQSTCLTFMTTKENLLKNKRYFLIFSDWFGSDFVLWSCITLGSSYFRYIKFIFNFKKYSLENMKVFGVMLFFGWFRFIANKRSILYMPIHTYATHLENNFLSPGIDWNKYFKDLG